MEGQPTTNPSRRRERRLALALGLNIVIVVAQVGFGVLAHSLGLIADAGHNLTDVAAIGLSLIAVRFARRPATGQRSFGYHRATILAAQANAVSILAITVFIVYEGALRLAHPSSVGGGIVVVVALLAAAANLLGAVALQETHAGSHGGHGDAGLHGDHAGGHAGHDDAGTHEDQGSGFDSGPGHDLNTRSVMLHLVGDGAASVGVAVVGAVILITGGAYWLDPIVSMAIGVMIAIQAWKLLRATTDVLLESTPDGVDVEAVSSLIAGMDGVEQVHDLHVWSLSSEMRALSAHLVLDGHPTLEEAQLTGSAVKAVLAQTFRIGHATLELECETCSPEGDWCAIDDVSARAKAGDQAAR